MAEIDNITEQVLEDYLNVVKKEIFLSQNNLQITASGFSERTTKVFSSSRLLCKQIVFQDKTWMSARSDCNNRPSARNTTNDFITSTISKSLTRKLNKNQQPLNSGTIQKMNLKDLRCR